MRGFVLSLLLVVIFSSLVQALTLEQAINLAQKQNPQIVAAQAKASQAQAVATQASWLNEPELMYEFMQIPASSLNPTNSTLRRYGLAQKIPFPYKLWLQGSAAAKQAQQAGYMSQQSSWNTRQAVIAAYFGLFLAEKEQEINQANLTILQGLSSVTQSKYAVLKAGYSDVLLAQIEAEKLANDQITLNQKVGLAKTELQRVLNQQTAGSLGTKPQTFEFNVSLEALNTESNFQLKSLAAADQARQDQLALAKWQYWPDLKTTVLERETPGVGLTGWDLNLSAEIPLWFWAQQAYVDYSNELQKQVETTYIQLDQAVRTEKLYRQTIVTKAKQALAAAQTAYQVNKLDFLSLLNIEKTYFNAQLIRYRNLVSMQIYKAKLEAMLGREI